MDSSHWRRRNLAKSKGPSVRQDHFSGGRGETKAPVEEALETEAEEPV